MLPAHGDILTTFQPTPQLEASAPNTGMTVPHEKKRACFHLVGYKCVPTTSRQYDYDYDEDEQTIPTIPCQCQIAHKSGAKTVCATLTRPPTQPKLSPGMPLNFLFFVSFLDVHVLRIKNRTE